MPMAGRLGAAGASWERRQKEGLGWSQPSEALSSESAGIRALLRVGTLAFTFAFLTSPLV